MRGLVRTTVRISDADYRRFTVLARKQGRPTAQLLREAIREYTRRHAGRRRARSVGLGHSRRGDVGERAEKLLAGLGRR
jgi:predicted transcriptional regulator